MTQFAWTDDRVETLKALWADDTHSAREIAKALGCPSRSAVIGKVHRLGLPGRQLGTRTDLVSRTHEERATRRPYMMSAKPGLNAKGRQQNPRGVAKLAGPVLPPVEPALTGNEPTLPDLTRTACRWPVGEATGSAQMFCGAPRDGAGSYCPFHAGRSVDRSQASRERVSRVMGGGGRVMR